MSAIQHYFGRMTELGKTGIKSGDAEKREVVVSSNFVLIGDKKSTLTNPHLTWLMTLIFVRRFRVYWISRKLIALMNVADRRGEDILYSCGLNA
jgi:hypothetical protein